MLLFVCFGFLFSDGIDKAGNTNGLLNKNGFKVNGSVDELCASNNTNFNKWKRKTDSILLLYDSKELFQQEH